jgi:hypothetical protein
LRQRLAPRLAGAVLPLALAACATQPVGPGPYGPPPPPGGVFIVSPYRAADFAWAQQPGGNGIRGRSPPGFSCAGLAVGLTPDAPYSRERIQKLYGSVSRADRPVAEIRSKTVANDNPDLARYVRSTRCDASGAFSFDGLPDGSYFMIAQVASPRGPLALMRHVVLRGNDVEPVQLTMTR